MYVFIYKIGLYLSNIFALIAYKKTAVLFITSPVKVIVLYILVPWANFTINFLQMVSNLKFSELMPFEAFMNLFSYLFFQTTIHFVYLLILKVQTLRLSNLY